MPVHNRSPRGFSLWSATVVFIVWQELAGTEEHDNFIDVTSGTQEYLGHDRRCFRVLGSNGVHAAHTIRLSVTAGYTSRYRSTFWLPQSSGGGGLPGQRKTVARAYRCNVRRQELL